MSGEAQSRFGLQFQFHCRCGKGLALHIEESERILRDPHSSRRRVAVTIDSVLRFAPASAGSAALARALEARLDDLCVRYPATANRGLMCAVRWGSNVDWPQWVHRRLATWPPDHLELAFGEARDRCLRTTAKDRQQCTALRGLREDLLELHASWLLASTRRRASARKIEIEYVHATLLELLAAMVSSKSELSVIARAAIEASRSASIIVQVGAIDAVTIVLREWGDQARSCLRRFERGAALIGKADDFTARRDRIARSRSHSPSP
ncbi:hypothetical protein HY634_00345 [Candidatus Uhrbacteria bacterium]|nr:hypothetical protein [Candidatus Uhrbacteria bacterium]